MRKWTAISGALLLATSPVAIQAATVEAPLMAIKADAVSGKVMATFARPAPDGTVGRYIYISQIESGVGSAPLAMDRGQASGSRLLRLRRIGKKLVAEVENAKFIASSGTEIEKDAIRQAFPSSVIWQGDIVDELANGGFTVDLAGFIARDDLGLAQALKDGGAGDFRFAPELSVADPLAVKAFPQNVELSAKLTFRADKTGSDDLRNILADSSLTLTLRHSLIALPDVGYTARTDPWGYTISRQVVDASAPLGQPMVHNLINRFRLEKADPAAARSPVKKPIVFYIDPAAPEPVRSALADGVRWWNDAFDAAGFVGAFRVEILPPDADALDVRYNVVNWINRATRGWSYGQAIDDPRTGETIKGSVMLGSLRVRQDILIFQALVGAKLTSTGDPNDPITAALARIRQLGAHEVGHSLGFNHNFAASTQGRYSVMDYPPPRIGYDGTTISIADAYGVGIGAWDKFLVDFVYGARTDAEGAAKVAAARSQGLRFVADLNARPNGSGHPEGAIWDDGANPVGELNRVMTIRGVALVRFGHDSVPAGASQSELRRAFVPIWLLHRYQVEAAAKSLGGIAFDTALAGDRLQSRVVPAGLQREALAALLATLDAAVLTVPQRLIPALTAGSPELEDRQSVIEQLPAAGRDIFDPLKATEIAAVHTLNALLDPARLNRLEAQNHADRTIPSAGDVIASLLGRTVDRAEEGGAIERRIATTVLLSLARVQRSAQLSPAIAAEIDGRLAAIADRLAKARAKGSGGDWARGTASLLRDRVALEKAVTDPARLPVVPPGMPI